MPSDRDLAALRSLARRIDSADPGANNNLGVLYYERGLFPEAIAAFTRALELDPRMTVARQNLEHLQKETGYYDRLVADLWERIRRSPREADLRLELGRAYLALGQPVDAIAQFEAMARLAPGDATAPIQLGLAEIERGRQEAAAGWFREACRLDPTSPTAAVHLARALYNQGMAEQALTALDDAVRLNPSSADAYYLLGFVYGELGRHDEARGATRRAMELNPVLQTAHANLRIANEPRARTAAPPLRRTEASPTQAHLNLGLAFRRRGFLTDALREFRLALEAGEDRDAALQGLAEAHLLRRDFAPALELYARLVATQPGHPGLWNDRAVCLHQAGRRHEALGAWRKAVTLDASYAPAWNNLGVGLALSGGTPGEAEAAFRTALRIRRDLTAARLNLALHLLRGGRSQDALETYRSILGEAPTHAGAWNGVGQVLMEMGQFSDARNAFVRAIEGDADLPAAHYNLGFCLSRLGRFDEALQATKRAIELEPYYVPQRFAFAVDLQFEEAVVPVDVPLSADVSAETLREPFSVDDGVLDQVFEELVPTAAAAAPAPGPDPFGEARALLARGQVDAAAKETARAMQLGAPRGAGLVLEGQILSKQGLHGEALERFRQAAEVDGTAEDPAALEGEARALIALGRADEALAVGDRLVAGFEPRAATLALRAEARRLAGDLAGAEADARDAAARQPGDAELLLLLGEILRERVDLSAARDACRAAVALDPGLAPAWHALGLVAERMGEVDEATAAYRRAIDLLPVHRDAVLSLAWLQRRRNRADEALELLVEYLLAEPTSLEAILLLGQVLLDQGRARDAEHAFRRVLRFTPDHLVALFHLGVSLARQRRYLDAVTLWDRVVLVSPTGPLAAQARRHIRSARDLAEIFAAEAV